MSQGNDFANYAAATGAGTNGSEDVWFVAVASDDIKQMSVDQLDEAFRLGVITADTAVWTEGMEAWAPLGQVADLESDSTAREDAAREDAAREGSASHGAQGYQDSRHDEGSRDERGYQDGRAHQDAGRSSSFDSDSSSANHAPSALTGGGYGAVTLQSVHGGPGSNSISPVTSSYAPSPQFGQSTGPVALNVDEDMPPIRHGRRFHPERWLLAAAALVGGVVTLYNNDVFSSSVAAEGGQAASRPALAARPYDGAERGSSPEAKSADEDAPSTAADVPSSAPSGSALAGKAAAADAAEGAKAKQAEVADDAEAPASGRAAARGGDKESLKGSFSKAFNNKKAPTAKATKVKPRSKAASRAATKARATRATKPSSKKPVVPRSQSAFDPLNGSLP